MDFSDLESLLDVDLENEHTKPVQLTPRPLEHVVVGIFKAIAAFHNREPDNRLFAGIMLDGYRTQRNLYRI